MNDTSQQQPAKHLIKVLLIDDQPMIGEAVRRMLATEKDILFSYCANAEQAIPTAITFEPTVIIQDLFMPGIDGLTMVKYFRRDPATLNIPLIVLSSEEDAKVKAEAFALGANDYMIKLPDRIELIARIRHHSRGYINLIERNEAFETILKNQAELLEAHNTLDAILSKVPMGIVILNIHGKVLWINRTALNMMKIANNHDIINHNFRDYIIDPQSIDIDSGELFNVERQLKTTDQQILPVLESVLKTAMNGSPVIICAFLDISDQKRAEQENKIIQVKLQQAQKLESIGKLAAGIAHEINTPLQFIHDNLMFINQSMPSITRVIDQAEKVVTAQDNAPALTEELKKALDEADIEFVKTETIAAVAQSIEGTERVAQIVMAMKEFANASGGKIAHYNLNKMISNTVTVCANQWRPIATMQLELTPDELDIMCCNEEINQVLLNLIVNAVQAIESRPNSADQPFNGLIKITSECKDGMAVITISDNGPGIPADIQHRIYEPFFTTREVGKGTGQGLTIAYDLVVNKHQGELSFTSAPDAGTTFTVKLPLIHTEQKTGAST